MITAVRLLRSVLKIRYLVVGSAVTGGVQLSRVSCIAINLFLRKITVCLFPQKYEEWKESLPKFKWIEDLKPDQDQLNHIRSKLVEIRDRFSADNGYLSHISDSVNQKIVLFREWIEEAKQQQRQQSLGET